MVVVIIHLLFGKSGRTNVALAIDFIVCRLTVAFSWQINGDADLEAAWIEGVVQCREVFVVSEPSLVDVRHHYVEACL